MNFDPNDMEQRRILAEQLLRDLVYGLEQLAREQGYLQHCINLKASVAGSHVRTLDNLETTRATREISLSVSGLIGRWGKVVGYRLEGDRVSPDNEAVAHICLDLDGGPRVYLSALDPDEKWGLVEEPRRP